MCLHSGRDPAEWLDSVSEETIHRWMAYYRNEPFGHDYERTAMLCQQIDRLIQVIAIANGAKEKDCPVRSIGDFMPSSWVGEQPPQPRKANFDAVQSAVQALFPTADKR